MIVVLRHAPQGSQVVLRSLLAYTPLGGWASQSEEELEGESRREGEKGWSSLSLSSKLGTTCHLSGRSWLFQACSELWTGDLSVSASLATSFSHSHSLSNHDTFSVNEKTNIQDIRMLLRRHYRQLLMATYTAENTH